MQEKEKEGENRSSVGVELLARLSRCDDQEKGFEFECAQSFVAAL